MAQPSDPSERRRPGGALNPYAAPASDIATAQPVLAAPASGRGPQIAGGFMLASATATLISMWSGGGGGALLGSAIVDVLLGVSLISGNLKLRGFAVVRVVLGALIFGGTCLASDKVLEGALTLAYAVPFLLLLIGTPGKARTIVGSVLGGLLLALVYYGLTQAR